MREVPQAKQEQADGQHAIHAHHGRMGVIRRQGRAYLIVADHRQIDQESKHAGPQKIPHADRDKEPDRPAVQVRFVHRILLPGFDKPPGLQGQQQQRDDLHRRKRRSERHMGHWRAAKVEMVHRADHAAEGVQNDVEVDDAQGGGFADDA